MGAPERELILQRLSNLAPEDRRFRLNAGQAWTGEIVRRTPTTLVLRNPRVFHGAPEGWPDLCGWDSVVVTPEMVGQTLAVFAGEEVKAHGGRLSRVQRLFRDCLVRMGGRWRVISERSSRPRLAPIAQSNSASSDAPH